MAGHVKQDTRAAERSNIQARQSIEQLKLLNSTHRECVCVLNSKSNKQIIIFKEKTTKITMGSSK